MSREASESTAIASGLGADDWIVLEEHYGDEESISDTWSFASRDPPLSYSVRALGETCSPVPDQRSLTLAALSDFDLTNPRLSALTNRSS